MSDALRAAIGSIDPVDEREAVSIERTLERLGRPPDPFDESADPHHLTASAFVVSSRGVVLHRHRRLGLWVQPGGHVDPGESPEVACVREVVEETGLVVARPTDVGAVTAAIGSLLDDPGRAAAMGEASRRRARASFDYDVLAPRLAAALEDVEG